MKTTSRASYQTHSNITLGNRKQPTVATNAERGEISKVSNLLGEARLATTEAQFVTKMTEAFRICRNICRGRIL